MAAYMNLQSSLDLESNVRGLLPHQIPFEIGFKGQKETEIKSSDCISMATASFEGPLDVRSHFYCPM